MLVDTGSAATILSEMTWRRAMRGSGKLQTATRPVVTANGQQLEVLGMDTVSLQVGDIQSSFPVLVLTQECLLGADYLTQHECLVNMEL